MLGINDSRYFDIDSLHFDGTPVDDLVIDGVNVWTRIQEGMVVDGDIVIGQHQGEWILVAPATKRAQMPWGLFGTNTALPNIGQFVTDPNTSKQNTGLLTGATYSGARDSYGNTGCPAAEYCRSLGYDLPNKEVLKMISDNKETIDALDKSGGATTLGRVSDAWSSSEYTDLNAWSWMFYSSGARASRKYVTYWVLPVRSIPV